MTSWGEIPEEIRSVIIEYALSDINLSWCGSDRNPDLKSPSTDIIAEESSPLKSMVLVSKRFISPQQAIIICLRRKILELVHGYPDWQDIVPRRLNEGFRVPISLKKDLSTLHLYCSKGWLSCGTQLKFSWSTTKWLSNRDNQPPSPWNSAMPTQRSMILSQPDISLLFHCLPKLRQVAFIGNQEYISIPPNHSILSITGSLYRSPLPGPTRQLMPEYKPGGRHGQMEMCRARQCNVGLATPTSIPMAGSSRIISDVLLESNFLSHVETYFSRPDFAGNRDIPSASRRASHCVWRGFRMEEVNGWAIANPSILAFIKDLQARGGQVQLIQPLKLTARGFSDSCYCDVLINGIFSFADLTLRSTYGGCEWIIPQTLPHGVGETLQQHARQFGDVDTQFQSTGCSS